MYLGKDNSYRKELCYSNKMWGFYRVKFLKSGKEGNRKKPEQKLYGNKMETGNNRMEL